MRRPRDIVDIDGLRDDFPGEPSASEPSGKRWLGVLFRCCNAYGRMYLNAGEGRYVGHCPKCRSEVRAVVGEGGTNRRFFIAE